MATAVITSRATEHRKWRHIETVRVEFQNPLKVDRKVIFHRVIYEDREELECLQGTTGGGAYKRSVEVKGVNVRYTQLNQYLV